MMTMYNKRRIVYMFVYRCVGVCVGVVCIGVGVCVGVVCVCV